MDERPKGHDDIGAQLRKVLADYALARVVCRSSMSRCGARRAGLRVSNRLGNALRRRAQPYQISRSGVLGDCVKRGGEGLKEKHADAEGGEQLPSSPQPPKGAVGGLHRL
jgi:hypothetical protein